MENIKGYSVTKEYLKSIPTPIQSRTYKPITHEQLIDLTLNSIVGAGFTVADETYTAAREGNVANGKFSIKNVADSEMCLNIAWQNSYDKSLSAKFALGFRVFICSNGAVSGDMGAFKKKHQGTIQEFVPTAITEYIKRAGDVFKQMQKEREEMKKIEISAKTRAELIGRMFLEEEFITSTQLNIIARELKLPTYNYGSPNSLWELYQFTTQSMKDIHPTLWMQNHIDAHNFFVNESGLLQPKDAIVVPPVGSHPQIEMFETNELV